MRQNHFEVGNESSVIEFLADSREIAAGDGDGGAGHAPATGQTPAGTGWRLPDGLALMERAAARLRAFLERHGVGHYQIVQPEGVDLHDLDELLPRLDPGARCGAMPLAGGEQPLVLSECAGAHEFRTVRPGVFVLPRRQVVIARWDWLDVRYGDRQSLYLAAAPSQQEVVDLRRSMIALRRTSVADVWNVVRGAPWRDDRPIPRRPPQAAGAIGAALDDLTLPEALLSRMRGEALRFFDPKIAAVYRSMGLSHRRGILLHGPPGNGKTSLIRALGASPELRDVTCMLLRPGGCFDEDDLQKVIRRWTQCAPAVLVIEDLDHLIEAIDLSQFLNLLDGIEQPREEKDGADDCDAGPSTDVTKTSPGRATGLLLIATTNHPEELDPAINNRPGRFDVVIEVSNPDASLRRRYFDRHLPEVEANLREELAQSSGGMSFSHLQEVLRLSGLLAIGDNAQSRTPEHLRKAVKLMKEARDSADRGFAPIKPEEFGLAQFTRRK